MHVFAVPPHEPGTGAVQEAVLPPLRPLQFQLPVEALYPEAVPAVQLSAVLLHEPGTGPPVQDAVLPPLRPKQLHVPFEAL